MAYNRQSAKQSEVMYGDSILEAYRRGPEFLQENEQVLDRLQSLLTKTALTGTGRPSLLVCQALEDLTVNLQSAYLQEK